jgi:allene oxide cyclase-like protein
MKRWVVVAALALSVGLVIGGISIAASRDHGITKKKVLTFVEVSVDEHFIDEEPLGTGENDVSPGDRANFHNELWNRAETKKRGDVYAQCEFIHEFVAHCRGTAVLQRGTIEVAGAIDFAEEDGPFFVAVTGGTEKYENVVGELKITPAGDTTIDRFELIPSFKRP